MRSAFHFSSECTVVAVSVDIYDFTPSGLPFCSIPTFTQPTMIPREPQIVLPPIVPPHICNCITFHGTAITGRVKHTISKPQFSMYVSGTQDCCDQDYKLFGQVDIPCMPLDVSAIGTIHATSITYPHMSLIFSRIARTDGECHFRFSIDIAIPKSTIPSCMAFSIVHSEVATEGDAVDFGVQIEQIVEGSHCRISFHFSLQYPRFSFPSGFSGFLTGPTGDMGPAGPMGPMGPTGIPGVSGAQGDPGTPGTPGTPGSRGSRGSRGPSGVGGGISCGQLTAVVIYTPHPAFFSGTFLGTFSPALHFGDHCTLYASFMISFPEGGGLPLGGLTYQVLQKKSVANFDVVWDWVRAHE